MSKSTKRKHVTKEVTDNYVLPSEKQTIVKVSGYHQVFIYPPGFGMLLLVFDVKIFLI